MFRFVLLTVLAAGLGILVALAGCGRQAEKTAPKPSPGAPTTPPKRAEPSRPADAKPSESKEAEAGKKDLPEGLAELPEADRALAEKQRICPVSGELLGSMGKPVKVTVKGKTVFLCCPACEKDLNKDPDKYLAKLTP